MMEFLRRAPFFLDDADVQWVAQTGAALSIGEKLAQLFVLERTTDSADATAALAKRQAGGYFRQGAADEVSYRRATQQLLDCSRVPPFICADVEGGHYSLPLCTPTLNNMGIAAANDMKLADQLARLSAREIAALGINWSFSPVADLALNPHSAVVGTRSFGNQPEAVTRHAVSHIRELRAAGVAATAKHWPGEGVDARDQHLVTTINAMSLERWHQTFGAIYSALIQNEVMAVMAGHIALPAYAAAQGGVGRDLFCPASMSAPLCRTLLRQELGFNGVVVSDASVMAGASGWARRPALVVQMLRNGCDVLLFSDHVDDDLDALQSALRSGELSEARVDEALTRVLGMKAALKLHRPRSAMPVLTTDSPSPPGPALVEKAARASITVVKDVDGQLPLRPATHRRVVIVEEPERIQFPGLNPRNFEPLLSALTQAGFDCRRYDPGHLPTPENTDWVLYLVGMEATPTLTSIRLDWAAMHGGPELAMNRFWPQLPTVMVSFGSPYCLVDATTVPTYLNAYCSIPAVQRAVVDVLLGSCTAAGRSPVDIVASHPEAMY